MSLKNEEQRIREAYARRDCLGKKGLYEDSRPEVIYEHDRLRSAISNMLNGSGVMEVLPRLEILDVGCGDGKWLRELREWGAAAERLHGIDLLPDRIESARKADGSIDYRIASGWEIPFADASVGMVSAFTVFSSILDEDARGKLAREIERVTMLNGWILIYDFRVSHPGNPDTTGIRKSEVRRLFPDFSLSRQTMTLLPQLSRRLNRFPHSIRSGLEKIMPPLRTHALYLLRKL